MASTRSGRVRIPTPAVAAPRSASSGSSSSSSSSSSAPVLREPETENSSLAACVRERFRGTTTALTWWLDLTRTHPLNCQGLDSANTIKEWATWYESLDQFDFNTWEADFNADDKLYFRYFSRMLQQYVPGFAGYIPQFVPTLTRGNPAAPTASSTTSGSVASATGGSSTSTLVPANAALRRNALAAAERTFNILQTGLPAHSDLEIYQVTQNKITYNKNGCASSPTLPSAPIDLTCIALGLNAAHEVIHRYVLEAQDLLVTTTNVGQDAQVRAKCKRQLLALNKFSKSIVTYYEHLYKFYYYVCGIYPCLVHAPLRNDLLSIDTIIGWIKRTAYKLSSEANDNTMYLAHYSPSTSAHVAQRTRQTFLWPEERSLLAEVLAMNLVVSYLGANQGAHWPKLLLDRIKVDVPQQFHGLKSANDAFLKIFTADGYIKRQAPQDHALTPKRKRGTRGRGGGGGGRGRGRNRGGGSGGGRSASDTQSSAASSPASSAGSSN